MHQDRRGCDVGHEAVLARKGQPQVVDIGQLDLLVQRLIKLLLLPRAQ
eukprot:CAMPEP_0119082210 /NCGR_PEP_ID=MMETSP1178-20130426/120301_1 /TAXON_ID=33656 /ORGANISM="unid sp, Strain CCMP2000" /LENGTH=47 /DNA_ID= /DNA_START= /DNA_END= /DNA_ORIENTATION=